MVTSIIRVTSVSTNTNSFHFYVLYFLPKPHGPDSGFPFSFPPFIASAGIFLDTHARFRSRSRSRFGIAAKNRYQDFFSRGSRRRLLHLASRILHPVGQHRHTYTLAGRSAQVFRKRMGEDWPAGWLDTIWVFSLIFALPGRFCICICIGSV